MNIEWIIVTTNAINIFTVWGICAIIIKRQNKLDKMIDLLLKEAGLIAQLEIRSSIRK